MSAIAVDPTLALEYVKALAGPVATLLGATIVARLAIVGFRRQKAIERRLDWYERMHRQLGATGRLYVLAAHMHGERRKERHDEAGRAASELAKIGDEGWMYADQRGFDAIQVLGEELARAHMDLDQRGAIQPPLAQAVSHACYRAANLLAEEMRRELRLSKVRPREGVTRTVELPPPAA